MDKFYERYSKTTADGSHTLYLPGLDEHYHSTHGAVSESRHVFIEQGFDHVSCCQRQINVLEVGFGTGLNAILTLERSAAESLEVEYLAVEPYPLSMDEAKNINLAGQVAGGRFREEFLHMHGMPYGKRTFLSGKFHMVKHKHRVQELDLPDNQFDMVYHDAFAPQFQPEMWDVNLFARIYRTMRTGGILTTYCAKGEVKRALKACGFILTHPPGPTGKREITRALKTD